MLLLFFLFFFNFDYRNGRQNDFIIITQFQTISIHFHVFYFVPDKKVRKMKLFQSHCPDLKKLKRQQQKRHKFYLISCTKN